MYNNPQFVSNKQWNHQKHPKFLNFVPFRVLRNWPKSHNWLAQVRFDSCPPNFGYNWKSIHFSSLNTKLPCIFQSNRASFWQKLGFFTVSVIRFHPHVKPNSARFNIVLDIINWWYNGMLCLFHIFSSSHYITKQFECQEEWSIIAEFHPKNHINGKWFCTGK